VARLGGEEGRLDRLEVAHFTDQDDVGSWRSADRMADAKDLVSTSSSRWLTIDFLSRWRNSTGSSIVMMCSERVALM